MSDRSQATNKSARAAFWDVSVVGSWHCCMHCKCFASHPPHPTNANLGLTRGAELHAGSGRGQTVEHLLGVLGAAVAEPLLEGCQLGVAPGCWHRKGLLSIAANAAAEVTEGGNDTVGARASAPAAALRSSRSSCSSSTTSGGTSGGSGGSCGDGGCVPRDEVILEHDFEKGFEGGRVVAHLSRSWRQKTRSSQATPSTTQSRAESEREERESG